MTGKGSRRKTQETRFSHKFSGMLLRDTSDSTLTCFQSITPSHSLQSLYCTRRRQMRRNVICEEAIAMYCAHLQHLQRPPVYQGNLTRGYSPISRVQRAGLGSNSDQWRMWVRVPIYVCLISLQFWWNISQLVEILDVPLVTSLWYLRFGRLAQRSERSVLFWNIPSNH